MTQQPELTLTHTVPALPVPEVLELQATLEPLADGRTRLTLRLPGLLRVRTFRERQHAVAYAQFIARRYFPTGPWSWLFAAL